MASWCDRELAAGLNHRLTIVRVPDGGYPDVAQDLIRRWARVAVVPVVMLPLTRQDCCPECLLDHLEAALMAEIDPVPRSRRSPEERLVDLINGLMGASQGLALVLVGLEAVLSPEVRDLIEMLVDYLPPAVHLYFVTPIRLPLRNLARLRVRRQLLEIVCGHSESPDSADGGP
ncbi:MAG: hypothetical protein JXC32_05615 [Anaerolineae bacterium]|nr:hypothetical protein [Anaerolineae bacterium]